MGTQQGQAFEDLRNTISECSRIVRYRWRLAIVGLSLVGAVAFWYSQYLPREYTAATIFERRDDVVLQDLIQGNSPYGFDHLKTTMALDMTGSRALAGAALASGLVPDGTFVAEGALSESERSALDRVLTQYKLKPALQMIHSSRSLDTIKLKCEANDPAVARAFVVALRENYIDQTRERIREILSSTKTFFAEEVERLQVAVATSEERLRAGFEEFPGLDPTDIVSVGNRLEHLRAQYNTAFQRQAELEAQITAREQFLQTAPDLLLEVAESLEGPPRPLPVAPPPTAYVDPLLDDALHQVRQKLVQEQMANRKTAAHPDVRHLQAQLAALEQLRGSLAEPAAESETVALIPMTQPTARHSPAYQEWQAQQIRVELELDALRRQLQVADAQSEEARQRQDQFAALYEQLVEKGDELRQLRETQEEGASELAIWQQHLTRLERILTAESGQRGTQFTLIEDPQDVVRPTRPRVASIFVVCAGLGLAAAALLVALAELFDRSFRSVGQVTRTLGVPVLESVGVIPTPRERRKAALARLIWTPTLVTLLVALVASATLAYASLELPAFHARAMHRLDGVLGVFGVVLDTPGQDSST